MIKRLDSDLCLLQWRSVALLAILWCTNRWTSKSPHSLVLLLLWLFLHRDEDNWECFSKMIKGLVDIPRRHDFWRRRRVQRWNLKSLYSWVFHFLLFFYSFNTTHLCLIVTSYNLEDSAMMKFLGSVLWPQHCWIFLQRPPEELLGRNLPVFHFLIQTTK